MFSARMASYTQESYRSVTSLTPLCADCVVILASVCNAGDRILVSRYESVIVSINEYGAPVTRESLSVLKVLLLLVVGVK